ncbi:MAG TPA: 2-oxo acid dehydrogenase subunit E2 [candidate division Zixibacteria bacterium]|nr:2-oxo acid dehydrogenase subunit E2 [candidate division Zixibacteria bacterium]
MALDVLVPQMGESVLEGTILEWKVKVGDKIKLNQPLVELMTDKVNIEIPAEAEGIITHLYVKEGDVVPVGTRIAVIDDGSGDSAPASKPEKESTPAASKAPTTASTQTTASVSVKATADVGKGKMSPKVRMMIREYGLDFSSIVPTGKEGRVTVDDVLRTVETRSTSAGYTLGPIPAPPAPMQAVSAATTPTSEPNKLSTPAEPLVKVEIPTFEPLPINLRETRKPVEGIRKVISDHMIKSVRTSPHVTTFEDIDLTELAAYRKEIKTSFKQTYGANITYLPFIVKAVCTALKEFPKMNASMTEKEIIIKNYYNIGIAVAREEGLIVPVIKDADKKTLVELAVEINDLGNKARTNQLLPDDVAGGTFSLTNAGMFGATASTPIINQPQVAILGIHAIVKKPWVVNDEIVVRYISSFGLSFDHRLIDGHIAVQFLHRVHEYLADTRRLLLQLR